jgi:uncharacterized integral membrane protein
MKRLSLVITVPLILVLVVFAVDNRQTIELNLWPFATVTTRLFLLALGMLAVGVLAGALFLWVPLARWRLRARSHERRAIELEAALTESRAMVTELRGTPRADALLAPPIAPPPH